MSLSAGIVIPHDSVNDQEVKIISCLCSEGSKVAKGQIVIEYETSKSIISIESHTDGYIAYKCEPNDVVSVGAEVAKIFSIWDLASVNEWKNNHNLSIDSESSTSASLANFQASQIDTKISIKAQLLMKEFSLSKGIFNHLDFLTVHDVQTYLTSTNNIVGLSSAPLNYVEYKMKMRIVIVCANKIANDMICDLIDNDKYTIIGYVIDEEYRSESPSPRLNTTVMDFPLTIDRSTYDGVVLAMGGSLKSMQFRRKIFNHYSKFQIPFLNLISKSANIANGVVIGSGNIIESNVYIGPGASIGNNNFISYSTTIGHHNEIGDCNLFAPGVMMAGLVKVGSDCILPTGVNFMDKVSIGNRVILPVGYNVTSNMSDDTIIKNKNKYN